MLHREVVALRLRQQKSGSANQQLSPYRPTKAFSTIASRNALPSMYGSVYQAGFMLTIGLCPLVVRMVKLDPETQDVSLNCVVAVYLLDRPPSVVSS